MGKDPFPIDEVKDAENFTRLQETYQNMVNMSLTQAVFPDCEKVACMKPVYKGKESLGIKVRTTYTVRLLILSLRTSHFIHKLEMASDIGGEESTSIDDDPYAEFLIIDRNYRHKFSIPFYLTLLDSASFSDYEVDFYLNKTQQMCEHEYSALIKGIPETFPPATGLDRMLAQNKAAEKALEVMARRCYTIKYMSHQEEITLLDIFKDFLPPIIAPVSQPPVQIDIQRMTISNNMVNHGVRPEGMQLGVTPAFQHQTSLPFNNPRRIASVATGPDTFGSKMLKKMGWDGGGLGKDGGGIIEPITSSLVSGRFGFGHLKRKEIEETAEKVGQPKQSGNMSIKKQKKLGLIEKKPRKQPFPFKKVGDERFTHRVRLVIQDFIENSDNEDLIFSTKLTPFQRKVIHDMAPEFNLTSISFGYKSNRHLVLFRAHSVDEFIERCIEKSKGNILTNFEVIPPLDSKELFSQKLAEIKGSVVRQKRKEAAPKCKFMIIDRNYNRNCSMASYLILLDSASFLGYKVNFKLATNGSCYHRYSVWINELYESFPVGTGKDKMAAYNSAAEKALRCLSRRFYTVKYKRHESEIKMSYLYQEVPDIPPLIQPSIQIKFDTIQNKALMRNIPSSTITQENVESQKVHVGHQLEDYLPSRVIKQDNMELHKVQFSHSLENFLPNGVIKYENIEVQQPHLNQLLKNLLPSGAIKQENMEVQQPHSSQLLKNFLPSGAIKHENMEVQQPHSSRLLKNFLPSGAIKHENMEVQQPHSSQLLKNFLPGGAIKHENMEVQQPHSSQLLKNFLPGGAIKHENIGVQQPHSSQLLKNFLPSDAIKQENMEVQQPHSSLLLKNFLPSDAIKQENMEVQQPHSSQLLKNFLPSDGLKHENMEVQLPHSSQLPKNFLPSGAIKHENMEVQPHSSQLLKNFLPSSAIKQENMEVKQPHSSQLLKNFLPSGAIKHEIKEIQKAHFKNFVPSGGIKHENKEGQQAHSKERQIKEATVSEREVQDSAIPGIKKKLTYKQKKNSRKERVTFWATVAVRNFIAKPENEELIFSSLLCEPHQKLVQEVAHHYKLKSVTFGYKKTRHLVVFRSSSADEYLQRCIEKHKGNVPVNFKVIPPTKQ
ncbi:uncharacterized protein [Palaemon carinicauda]|uniref:uncharacterized protein n=1 Tax=Palaemon carinicauda TaxID=392227 RepID=UPI0035B60DAD